MAEGADTMTCMYFTQLTTSTDFTQFPWDSSNKLTLKIVIYFLSCDIYERK